MADIESESRVVWKLIKDILLLPFTFILFVFRKKSFLDLFQPIKDLIKFAFEAKLTIFLVIANVVVYFGIYILYINNIINDSFIETYFIDKPEYILQLNILPIVGSWFFHASIPHLLSNMLFLFILGRVVEREVGAVKTLLVYAGAAIISTALDNAVHLFLFPIENYSSLGASGAIMGLGSAALLLNPFYITWLAFGIPLPIIAVVILQMYTDVTNVFNPSDNIGHFAHLGGFLSIAVLMFFLDQQNREKMKKGFIISLVTVVIAVLGYFLFKNYLKI